MHDNAHESKCVHMHSECLSKCGCTCHPPLSSPIFKELRACKDETEAASKSHCDLRPLGPQPDSIFRLKKYMNSLLHNWSNVSDSNSINTLFLFLYINGKHSATSLVSFLFSVSLYAFNLEQSKVCRLQDYKHYIKVFKLVLLQAKFLGHKSAQNFPHTQWAQSNFVSKGDISKFKVIS